MPGRIDDTLKHLGLSLLPALRIPEQANRLFLDHLTLGIHVSGSPIRGLVDGVGNLGEIAEGVIAIGDGKPVGVSELGWITELVVRLRDAERVAG